MLIVSASYGNDSIALIQWLHERSEVAKHGRAIVVYANTGWAAHDWPARVEQGEALARGYGFEVARVERASGGFVPLARLRKAWPRNGMQFCTSDLKVEPITAFLEAVDPAREATIAIGVRREESAKRAAWPEHVPESPAHGGRDAWFPLVRVRSDERNALVARAGFEVLQHRSRECYPCVNSSREDLRMLDDERVAEIEALETEMGHTGNGKARTLFRPAPHGGAVGIREVVRWARSAPGRYSTAQQDLLGGLCDSGWCGS